MPLYHEIVDEADEFIWGRIVENEGKTFKTARGLPFAYRIKRSRDGEILGEIVVDRRNAKTITRGTVVLAYKKMLTGTVTGPKKLGVFGASYLWPVLVSIGVCGKEAKKEQV